MSRKFLLCTLALFTIFFCTSISLDAQSRTIFRRVKPTVFLVPVINSSEFEFPWITEAELPWSVSEELTYEIRDQFARRGQFFLISEEETAGFEYELPPGTDYFGCDLEFAANIDNADFLVIINLLSERFVPYKERRYHFDYHYGMLPLNWVLQMTAKIRIIDLRKGLPRLITDKLILRNHLFPRKHDISIDYYKEGWGTDFYLCTPLGLIHRRFSEDLARAIFCIIWRER
jgi:hypothetical protein